MLKYLSLKALDRQLKLAIKREQFNLCVIIQKEQQRRCQVTSLPPFQTTKELELLYNQTNSFFYNN